MADVMVYGSLLKVSHRPSAKANEKKTKKNIKKSSSYQNNYYFCSPNHKGKNKQNINTELQKMKKLALTIAIVLGLTLTTFANNDGGLFQRGASEPTSGVYGDREGGIITPIVPNHGETGNQNAPLGSGVAVLLGLGAAYMVAKKRREE
ncbi:MAG: hypothetical protein IJK78_09655 [Bacteroidales bacterium]|nr:hypothetical protein [Bacteroidales bacterium]